MTFPTFDDAAGATVDDWYTSMMFAPTTRRGSTSPAIASRDRSPPSTRCCSCTRASTAARPSRAMGMSNLPASPQLRTRRRFRSSASISRPTPSTRLHQGLVSNGTDRRHDLQERRTGATLDADPRTDGRFDLRSSCAANGDLVAGTRELGTCKCDQAAATTWTRAREPAAHQLPRRERRGRGLGVHAELRRSRWRSIPSDGFGHHEVDRPRDVDRRAQVPGHHRARSRAPTGTSSTTSCSSMTYGAGSSPQLGITSTAIDCSASPSTAHRMRAAVGGGPGGDVTQESEGLLRQRARARPRAASRLARRRSACYAVRGERRSCECCRASIASRITPSTCRF